MSSLCTVLLLTVGALDVWVESPLVRVFPDYAPKRAARSQQFYCARGEAESVQVFIRANDEPADISEVIVAPLSKDAPAPEVRRVGYLRVTKGDSLQDPSRDLWPDPLLDFAPFSLAPGETAAIWLTYRVPTTASPGLFRNKVTIVPVQGKKRSATVSMRALEFEIPEIPTLRCLFPLDREALRRTYGLVDADLERWKPIYDSLASNRISYSVWDGGDLVVLGKEGFPDTNNLRRHVEYAVRGARMTCVDIGAGPEGLKPFISDGADVLRDPLVFYLSDVSAWLREDGWLDKAVIEPARVSGRDSWEAARDECFRVKRSDWRIKRLLVAEPHPFFDLYADVWAFPLRRFDPFVVTRMREGISLGEPVGIAAERIEASSCAKVEDISAKDAYDGSVFTYWVSEKEPTAKNPEWLEVSLKEPVTVSRILVVWRNGLEAGSVRLLAGGDELAEIKKFRWAEFPPSGPFAQSHAEVTLDKSVRFKRIRLEFLKPHMQGPVGVTELIFGEEGLSDSPERVSPSQPWLALERGSFPRLNVDASRIEARIIPWVCHGHQLDGYLYRSLNTWPKEWVKLAQEQPLVWPSEDAGGGFLYYPGRENPIPSIRSELIREGMEDYEYLVLFSRRGKAGVFQWDRTVNLAGPRVFPWNPLPEDLDLYTQDLPAKREQMALGLGQSDRRRRS